MGRLFGTDGIRGVANEYPMTAEMAIKIGRAVACLFKRPGHIPRIIIGKDTRISGDMLEGALAAGICSMEGNAIMTGVLPTSGVAFLTGSMRADAGIVISASHNPLEDNGIKLFGSEGFKLPEEKEAAIEELLFSEHISSLNPAPRELGRATRLSDAGGRYIVFLKHSFPKNISVDGIRIALDCAHGAAYKVAPDTFRELGAEVTT
ncbi:MAG: phosphoglucosamine mutase, partial [Syntrophales bacterium]|nr:phosphoglucosamine mutase [Syntrophales bacterium]